MYPGSWFIIYIRKRAYITWVLIYNIYIRKWVYIPWVLIYYILAKKKLKIKYSNFLSYVTPRLPMSVHNKFSPFSPAVWPARGNIYVIVLFYYLNIRKWVYVPWVLIYYIYQEVSICTLGPDFDHDGQVDSAKYVKIIFGEVIIPLISKYSRIKIVLWTNKCG